MILEESEEIFVKARFIWNSISCKASRRLPEIKGKNIIAPSIEINSRNWSSTCDHSFIEKELIIETFF